MSCAFFTTHCGQQTASEPDEQGGFAELVPQPFSRPILHIKLLKALQTLHDF
jgi:hypothetical protein